MAEGVFPTKEALPTQVWPRQGVRPLIVVGMLASLLGAFLLDLMTGSVAIPANQIILILTGNEPVRATWTDIVLLFRLPKAITAACAGAALGVAGLHMQTLFRNPLADPFVLGISSGASLGVALVVLGTASMASTAAYLSGLGFIGNIGVLVAASLGAGAVMLLIMLASQRVPTMTLLILGVMVGYAVSAFVSLLLYFSVPEQIQVYIAWTFGTFGSTSWEELAILVPVIGVALGASYLMVKPLNALLLGENYARSMGLPIKRVRFWLIAIASVLAGAITAFCGPIGFLGIAVPHLCRALLRTSDHKVLVPATISVGATLALLLDLIAQVPGSDLILPLNAVAALVGAPMVIWVILQRRKKRGVISA